ncbi:MAG: hypothetical protein QW179_02025 [Candidatus Hadarchaeales archaeon]
MKKPPPRKYCPNCGSERVRWASGLPQLWSIYECLNCGYRGALIIEDGKIARKISEKRRSSKFKKGGA